MRGKRSFFFLFLAFLPLLIALQFPQHTETLHQFSLTVFRPLFGAAQAIAQSFRKTGENFLLFWNLYQSHGALRERVSWLEQELIQKEELEKENARLRNLLEFKKEIAQPGVAARVIGWDLAPWRRMILIDKGSQHGIQKRMAVVSHQGLVGRVLEAAPFSSRVILLPDPESRVSVIFKEGRDLGVAEGDGSSWLRVRRISREASLKVGDRVLSSGLGGVYPKGLPVGQVEMVGSEKETLEVFATVRPLVDFSKLEEVLCLTSSPSAS